MRIRLAKAIIQAHPNLKGFFSGVEAGAATQDPLGIGYKCVEAAVKAIKGEQLP